jgi:CheY-like chemotaxis protein
MPHDPTARFRILLACTAQGEPVLRPILEPLAEIVVAFDHEEAIAHIERGVDLVLCSLRFDESRTLDLIAELARQRPHLPVVCCRVMQSDLGEASLRAAFVAAGHLGAVALVNLPELERREGAAPAQAKLRAAVLDHLHGVGHASMS